jgi:hypothetical protein
MNHKDYAKDILAILPQRPATLAPLAMDDGKRGNAGRCMAAMVRHRLAQNGGQAQRLRHSLVEWNGGVIGLRNSRHAQRFWTNINTSVADLGVCAAEPIRLDFGGTWIPLRLPIDVPGATSQAEKSCRFLARTLLGQAYRPTRYQNDSDEPTLNPLQILSSQRLAARRAALRSARGAFDALHRRLPPRACRSWSPALYCQVLEIP